MHRYAGTQLGPVTAIRSKKEEAMNTLWIVVIGVLTSVLAYNLYAKRIDRNIIRSDAKRATPRRCTGWRRLHPDHQQRAVRVSLQGDRSRRSDRRTYHGRQPVGMVAVARLADSGRHFGGKGGVDKTVFAAAAAIGLARQRRRTLLASTNPVQSLTSLLGQDVLGKHVAV